jgi:hypothetical protein
MESQSDRVVMIRY